MSGSRMADLFRVTRGVAIFSCWSAFADGVQATSVSGLTVLASHGTSGADQSALCFMLGADGGLDELSSAGLIQDSKGEI